LNKQEVSLSNVKGMRRKVKAAFICIFQPRMIIFMVALYNFIWFFSRSRIIFESGSNGFSFCVLCPWYWDWSLTNLPSLSLAASASMLVARWKGYLIACGISLYQIIDGVIWVSNTSGFSSGIQQRLKFIRENESAFSLWDLPDVQYLLAWLIFITGLMYLTKNILVAKQTPKIPYP
jgi:hypothetical protein